MDNVSHDLPERIDQTPDPEVRSARLFRNATLYLDDLEEIYRLADKTQRFEESHRHFIKTHWDKLHERKKREAEDRGEEYKIERDEFLEKPMLSIQMNNYRFRDMDQVKRFHQYNFGHAFIFGDNLSLSIYIDTPIVSLSMKSSNPSDIKNFNEIVAVLKKDRVAVLPLIFIAASVLLWILLPWLINSLLDDRIDGAWSVLTIILLNVISFVAISKLIDINLMRRRNTVVTKYKSQADRSNAIWEKSLAYFISPLIVGLIILAIQAWLD